MTTNLTATTDIQLVLTPQKAMELIRTLSTYAADGKDFEVTVRTRSESYDSDIPVGIIGVGMSQTSGSLNWATTRNQDKELTIHFDATTVGA
jgi:hypothetical protein